MCSCLVFFLPYFSPSPLFIFYFFIFCRCESCRQPFKPRSISWAQGSFSSTGQECVHLFIIVQHTLCRCFIMNKGPSHRFIEGWHHAWLYWHKEKKISFNLGKKGAVLNDKYKLLRVIRCCIPGSVAWLISLKPKNLIWNLLGCLKNWWNHSFSPKIFLNIQSTYTIGILSIHHWVNIMSKCHHIEYFVWKLATFPLVLTCTLCLEVVSIRI